MERAREPLLDAKSGVTNQVSEWPPRPVLSRPSLGRGRAAAPGPPPAAGGQGHPEPSPVLPDRGWCPQSGDVQLTSLPCSFPFAPEKGAAAVVI
ncbi:PREDICTED: COMM domain-containing protein 6 isoform X1 [Galeopterus variegatus]|uniref:COMM domain-containing protein 6 isoform X1 n=1 Tax=Galeopterus variegatus TaxID=482537 RepID=A0ABM0RDH8_GALVR|nr:PREDICTED: COMM domain-containing protein 6 isoform X1 [Galeopterus variegatus]